MKLSNEELIYQHLGEAGARAAIEEYLANGFLERKPSGCLVWTGSLRDKRKGYGRITKWVDGRQVHAYAHRFVYRVMAGPVPDGCELDHVKEKGCTHRTCCEVKHLEPVSHRENILRGDSPQAVNARKEYCPEGHPLILGNLISHQPGRNCAVCHREYHRVYIKRWRRERRQQEGII